MSSLPPNGRQVSQFDALIEHLVAAPGEWQQMPKYGQTTKLRRRYGTDFQFATRSASGAAVLWGRYVGEPGAFSLDEFYTKRLTRRSRFAAEREAARA